MRVAEHDRTIRYTIYNREFAERIKINQADSTHSATFTADAGALFLRENADF